MMKLVLMLCSIRLVLASLNASKIVKFYAMSDGPLGIKERSRFVDQLRGLDTRSDFVVHLGDMHERQKECDHDQLQFVADTMRMNLLQPTFVLPGDNDFYECDNQASTWEKWTSLFVGFEDHWTRSFIVARQADRPENFVFVLKNILFIGVHIINASVQDWESWNKVVHDDAVWLEASILAHLDEVESIVIMSHAFPHTRRYREFYDTFVRVASSSSDKFFLYLQGDEKKFVVDHIFPSQNVFRVVLDQTGMMDPTEITIDPTNVATPFKIKRRPLLP
jgi:hypothetical protein